MLITITDTAAVHFDGAAALVEGTDERGRTVRFPMTTHAAMELKLVAAETGTAQTEIEGWQVLGVLR